ncbi:hypothetical protein L2E82_47523 [Cichorium intybus]|uniref:Uncharacterized protein n=1 Tax=Cichorium intybus TaxID=13427 RepID=A0ACB8YWA3_CICIN|nr:hypothetical protein L2E82_47523 [Cichorium intybus]
MIQAPCPIGNPPSQEGVGICHLMRKENKLTINIHYGKPFVRFVADDMKLFGAINESSSIYFYPLSLRYSL